MGFAAIVRFEIPLIASASLNFGVSATAGRLWSMNEGTSESFAKSASESESYSKSSSTSQKVDVIMRDGCGPKPAWAEKHCGSWYAVPVIGPADGNLEICGRGGYCARHKLTDRNCYTFKRGYDGSKSAHIVSAKVSPGTCCVLSSRYYCHGLSQVIKGDVPDFSAVGFEELAHSVICNVDEYCTPVTLGIVKPAA